MIMRLYASEEARGDVLTPFFPPANKAVGNWSFTVKQFNQLLEIVDRRAILLLKARPTPPNIIKVQNMSAAGKNKVTLIILDVLRFILNDGRCQARAFWRRTIGYFIFHPSPMVYINVVDDTAARPHLESAEDSPSFAFKRAHLASPSGSIQGLSWIYPRGLYPCIISVSTSDTRRGRISKMQYENRRRGYIYPDRQKVRDYIGSVSQI